MQGAETEWQRLERRIERQGDSFAGLGSDSAYQEALKQEMRKSHLNNVVFVALNAIILIIASLVLKQEMRKLLLMVPS